MITIDKHQLVPIFKRIAAQLEKSESILKKEFGNEKYTQQIDIHFDNLSDLIAEIIAILIMHDNA